MKTKSDRRLSKTHSHNPQRVSNIDLWSQGNAQVVVVVFIYATANTQESKKQGVWIDP